MSDIRVVAFKECPDRCVKRNAGGYLGACVYRVNTYGRIPGPTCPLPKLPEYSGGPGYKQHMRDCVAFVAALRESVR
jgi:hypothetical protein